MAYRLILAMGLLSLSGCGGARLVERPLQGVGVISVPARAAPINNGAAYDEDPTRLFWLFERGYGMTSLGSGPAYRQLLHVSLLAPDAEAAGDERWPQRFAPLYEGLRKERTIPLGDATLSVSAGRYVQNALDEPAHVYAYTDSTRRLKILWHAVDEELPPQQALELLPRIAASFQLRTDPRERFAEMAGRAPREQARAAAAVVLARETLARHGFGDAAPGRPVLVDGVYAEWMDDPEPRLQLLKPLGLLRVPGGQPPVPRLRDAAGKHRDLRGSIGWRARTDAGWASDNRDNAYLPMPGIEHALAARQADESTVLYYFATTLRLEQHDEQSIAALGRFFEELMEVERAWAQGTLVAGERAALAAVRADSDSDGRDADRAQLAALRR